jgi:ribosome-binding protein aMBF1 (putative translation factor)
MDISQLSKSELDTKQIEVEQLLHDAIGDLAIVESADNRYATAIARLQLKRKELADKIIKGKAVVRQYGSDLRVIKLATWKKIAQGEI